MREFRRAMAWWGFEYKIFSFPDRELAYFPLKTMATDISNYVEEVGVTTLMSFSPQELTFGFDHPDHNVTGAVTQLVSTGMTGDRGLWYWTSYGEPTFTKERYDYARKYYPSQKIPINILKNIGETI